jgi:hypothetical protein
MLCANLNYAHLMAAEHCASTDEKRPGIQGVRIEAMNPNNRSQGVAIVSTNGHMLSCRHDPHAECMADFTLTLEALHEIKTMQRTVTSARAGSGKTRDQNRGLLERLVVRITREGFEFIDPGIAPGDPEIKKCFASFVSKAFVDVSFPNWRTVVPAIKARRVDGPSQFNPAYLAALHEAAGLSRSAMRNRTSFLDLYQFDAREAFIVIDQADSDWFGLLMPINNQSSPHVPAIPFLQLQTSKAA